MPPRMISQLGLPDQAFVFEMTPSIGAALPGRLLKYSIISEQ
jgi:hypothetical protein